MNGAEAIIGTLADAGVSACFANPGTSEIHLVAALAGEPRIRSVLCLFEGVAAGAADGFARMTGRPAFTLLHMGPGLANGLANLHNASRARVPLLNVVGDHATWHRDFDAPLTSDIAAIARPYSSWIRSCALPENAGRDCADALLGARTPSSAPDADVCGKAPVATDRHDGSRTRASALPGRIATLIVPSDVAWSEGGRVAAVPEPEKPPATEARTIETVAAKLRSGKRSALLLGGAVLTGDALMTAARIAAVTSTKLFSVFNFPRIERGAGRPRVERIAYVAEQARKQLAGIEQLILVGAQAPVSFFGYPSQSSLLAPEDCDTFALCPPDEDCAGALEALAEAVDAMRATFVAQESVRPAIPDGDLTVANLAATVGAVLPEHAIVVDESVTSGRGMMVAAQGAPPHDWLVNPGGSIGMGLPLAVGAAVAAGERPILCLEGDGSAMYTPQALWTAARENLAITFVVFANKTYAILKGELGAFGMKNDANLFDIGRPNIDFVSLARSLGVPARRVAHCADFAAALKSGFESKAPNLIEVPL